MFETCNTNNVMEQFWTISHIHRKQQKNIEIYVCTALLIIIFQVWSLPSLLYVKLKSLGPIERNFCRHGENDLESMCIQLKNPVSFCKHTNINVMNEIQNKQHQQQPFKYRPPVQPFISPIDYHIRTFDRACCVHFQTDLLFLNFFIIFHFLW